MELRPVKGIEDGTVLGDLYGVRDGKRRDDAVRAEVSRGRRNDSPYEVRGDEAARPIMDEHDRLGPFSFEQREAATSRERTALGGKSASSVLAYTRLFGEDLNAAPISDRVD